MKRFSLLLASCATVLFFLPNIALSQSRSSDAMIFVKAGCTGSGTSWSDAVGDLSAAVQIVSENGGTVYIGDGTYTLTSTLSVPAGVALVGDKSVNGPVVTISGDGGILTLEEGTADRYASVAGIMVSGATAGRGLTAHAYARIVDCIIENNTVTAKETGEADTYAADGNSGAGLWLGANTLLERSIVRGNTNAYIVGGVSIPSNNVTIKNCLIADNMSNGSMTGKGNSVGGILIWHNLSLVGIRIINTTVASNVGKSIGGAWMLRLKVNGLTALHGVTAKLMDLHHSFQ